jgi:polyphosphate kinase
MDVLNLQLADTDRAWLMQSDGQYARIDKRGKTHLDSQLALCERSVAAAQIKAADWPEYRFEPAVN